LDLCSSLFCTYNAPYFAYKKDGRAWGIAQGNCHHWDCPKCGEGRAKKEYGRIVAGCSTIETSNLLYFITVTCRGRDLRLQDAMSGYLQWTNRLLDALRCDAKKRGCLWCYVQVTEQQGRGHPHSHILTTYFPDDIVEGKKVSYETDAQGRKHRVYKDVLRSAYLQKRVLASGLGEQYDISLVDKAAAASRYVSKYLFHPDMFKAKYPKGWKRVRYSQNFPHLPSEKSTAIVLLTRWDWLYLASEATTLTAQDDSSYNRAKVELKGHDLILLKRDIPKGLDNETKYH